MTNIHLPRRTPRAYLIHYFEIGHMMIMNNVITLTALVCVLTASALPVIAAAPSSGCQQMTNGQCTELKWEKVPLQSGEVAEIAIAPSNPDIMYAGFEVNSHSLYKSTDGGRTWRRVHGGGDHTKDVAVSSQDANRVYFAMSESLETTNLAIRSTAQSLYSKGPRDRNRETQLVLTTGIPAGGSAVSFSSVEIFAGDDQIIYTARQGGPYGPGGAAGITPKIYATRNGGETWDETEPNLPEINVLAIHPRDPATILIGSREGIFISRDRGQTLSTLAQLPNTISLEYQINNPNVILAASDAQALKSADGGQSWQNITGPLRDIHRVRASLSHPDILYASTGQGILRSDNGGREWRNVSGNLAATNIQIVAIHPANPDIAFAGHSSLWSSVRAEDRYRTGLLAHQGIFRTADGGQTWTRSDSGIEEYRFEDVAAHPTKPHEAWVASPASRGGYKTSDGGHTWRLSQTPTLHYPMHVKYSRQDPDTLYATGWQNMAPFSVSINGGVNWEFISEELFFGALNRGRPLRTAATQAIHLHGLAVDPANDQIVYTGSVEDALSPLRFLPGAHIFKSTDGGQSWTESDEGFPHDSPTAIHDLAVDPTNTNIIYAATTRHEATNGIGVFKSTDAGRTWQAANRGLTGDALNANTIIINPRNGQELVVATFGGLFRSDNAGASWQQTSTASSFDVEYVADDPATVYASTNEGVLKSRDFGASWYAVNFGLPVEASQRVAARFGFHDHSGAGIGVDTTGNVIYAAIQDHGLFVARLTDVPAHNPVTEFGSSYGYGPSNGFGRRLGRGPAGFLIILALLAGLLVILPMATLGIITVIRRQRR